jgi:hypothetical protein
LAGGTFEAGGTKWCRVRFAVLDADRDESADLGVERYQTTATPTYEVRVRYATLWTNPDTITNWANLTGTLEHGEHDEGGAGRVP